jgi:hypothetical protein
MYLKTLIGYTSFYESASAEHLLYTVSCSLLMGYASYLYPSPYFREKKTF